jgi:hypothetical protein
LFHHAIFLLLFTLTSSAIAQSTIEVPYQPGRRSPSLVWRPVAGSSVRYYLLLREIGVDGSALSSRTVSVGSLNYALLPKFNSKLADRYEIRVQARSGTQVIGMSDILGYESPDGPGTLHCVYDCPTGAYSLQCTSPSYNPNQYFVSSRSSTIDYFQHMSYSDYVAAYNNGDVDWTIDGQNVINLGLINDPIYCNSLGQSLAGETVIAVRIPFPAGYDYGETSALTTNVCALGGGLTGLETYFNSYVVDPADAPLPCPPVPCVFGGGSSLGGGYTPDASYHHDWIDSILAGFSPCDMGMVPDWWCDGSIDNGGFGYDPVADELYALRAAAWDGLELGDLVREVSIKRLDDFGTGMPVRYNVAHLDAQGSGDPSFTIDMASEPSGLYVAVMEFTNRLRLSHTFIRTPGSSAKAAAIHRPALKVEVYPTPSSTQATIAITLDAAASIRLSLVDLSGRQLQSVQLDLPAGRSTHAIDVVSLPAGMYLARVSGPGFSVIRRLEVLH